MKSHHFPFVRRGFQKLFHHKETIPTKKTAQAHRISKKSAIFGQSGPENGLLNGRTDIYRKTEGIQSYLRIWGRYDPIEPGLFEAKKVGYMGLAK